MNKSLTFVYYRLPNKNDFWSLQTNFPIIEINSLQNIPSTLGFIFHPFSMGGSSKPVFIQADKHVRLSLEDIPKDECWNLETLSNGLSKTKDEYCQMVSTAIEEIKSRRMQKVVLSRIKKLEKQNLNPLKAFSELCTKYPSAFVSLVHIPGEVTWLTATPELLLSQNGKEINTVSLAGTKPLDSTDVWGEKEKEEQQFVTDYIKDVLSKYCTDINVSEAKEVVAGSVKHLKSTFSANLKSDLWSLVSALHPTPAICGIPVDNVKKFILQSEGYDRKYYTGFLGPCNIDGKTNLFVNLRCAELFSNSADLYVGGGITKDSLPEKEWEETELKATTIKSILENL